MFERTECEILGSRASYLHAGKERSPVLILIHGGGSDYSEFSWRAILPELSTHFSIYAPDLPGYGYSSLPSESEYKSSPSAMYIRERLSKHQKHPATNETSTLELHTIFLKHFIDQLGLNRPNLAGFSMGGAICLLYGLVAPQGFNRIAAINSYGVSGRIRRQKLAWITARIPFLSETLRFVLSRSTMVMRLALGELVTKRHKINKEMVTDAMNSVRLVENHPLWKQFVREEIFFTGCNLNMQPSLYEVGDRICLLQTDKDRLFYPNEAREAADNSGASFKLLKGAGHIPARECPAALGKELIAFLQGD